MERSNLVSGNTALHLRASFFQAGEHPFGEFMVEARLLVSRSFHQRSHDDAFGFRFPLSHLFFDLHRQFQVQHMLSLVGHPFHPDVEFWNRRISSFALDAARTAILEGHSGFLMGIGIRIGIVDPHTWSIFEGGAELVDESLILSSGGDFGEAEAVNEFLIIRSLERNGGSRGEFGGVPASKSSINALETRRFEGVQGHESTSACVVCFEDFETGVEVTAMPCSHEFHRTCLSKWLEQSHLCPLCRFPIPTVGSRVPSLAPPHRPTGADQ